jgi:NADH-ubiquinone oxidoreductase chain 4
MIVGLLIGLVRGLLIVLVVNGFTIIILILFLLVAVRILLIVSYPERVYLYGWRIYLDGVRVSLVILRSWVRLLMLISSYRITRYNEYANYFVFLVLFLMTTLFISFFIRDYLGFYFFFEVSLIPTLLIIMGWGYQPERLQAGVYFIFYTLRASLPLLLIIIYFYVHTGTLEFNFSKGANNIKSVFEVVLILICAIAFLVKLPIFFTHLWLPKAHVEAPVAGSIILAGVLLKLGGYGLFRIFIVIGPIIKIVSSYFVGLSLIGMVYVGLICCRINDFKALVAYSSVAHIALVICGVIGLFYWGFRGSLIIIVSHGISSSGLFCIVNIYYERLGSRRFYINRGLILLLPTFSLLLFLLAAANIAAPPTINLISEIFLMRRILGFNYYMILVFPIGSFLGAVFTIFIFSFSQHGKRHYSSYGVSGRNFREAHGLVLHVIPLNLLILAPAVYISI